MKKVLVTGGAGFIGSHLVERLVKDNYNIIVIDDLSLGKEENLSSVKSKIIFYKKSICEDLNDIFKKEKFDCVFHVAALPRVQFSNSQMEFQRFRTEPRFEETLKNKFNQYLFER